MNLERTCQFTGNGRKALKFTMPTDFRVIRCAFSWNRHCCALVEARSANQQRCQCCSNNRVRALSHLLCLLARGALGGGFALRRRLLFLNGGRLLHSLQLLGAELRLDVVWPPLPRFV